jgi:hypothetical protein
MSVCMSSAVPLVATHCGQASRATAVLLIAGWCWNMPCRLCGSILQYVPFGGFAPCCAVLCRDRGLQLTVHTRRGQPFRPSQLKKVCDELRFHRPCMFKEGMAPPPVAVGWLLRGVHTHEVCLWVVPTYEPHKGGHDVGMYLCTCPCVQVSAQEAAIVVLLHPEGARSPADAEALKAAAGVLKRIYN